MSGINDTAYPLRQTQAEYTAARPAMERGATRLPRIAHCRGGEMLKASGKRLTTGASL
ncbi:MULTISPECIES: hypothetical protein [unclassified Variovorax]|uniref:hypothetical protein n=1 Tax=unclassified Variovorax TaxID=663243 RepID=UPI000AD40CEA|nr:MULTISPECIES: hypothetical protein [unclassified Variovorax]PNG48922.1 hypothetical protein CHC07_06712 [Variovorax sp. B4]PNG49778.1 hypothetical protein CHC06_05359 [Variovorax sp. B2]PNG50625.1 hypothetical protein CHC06_06249 [Variovorax sp. B2]VTV17818.1 hypothetical protein WDL1P1_00684 [Variovorax sp. WDL1]VTV18504.1 hypothetical protein WDL1P2_00207 [Variovorax sp. WDL1]